MLTTRTRITLISAAVAAAAATGVTCNAFAGQSSSGASAAPSSSAAPCRADSTTLVGRLDGDAYPDKITDPDHKGRKMTVQWGTKDGSYGEPQSVNKLLGVRKNEIGTVAVADFKNTGRLDMVVGVVEPSPYDDPNPQRVAEFRAGPVDRELHSAHTTRSDLGKEGEAHALQIADYNGDKYPDLAISDYAGDGQTARSVRLSRPDGGLGTSDPDANRKYGEESAKPDWPALPHDGWAHFYKPCS